MSYFGNIDVFSQIALAFFCYVSYNYRNLKIKVGVNGDRWGL